MKTLLYKLIILPSIFLFGCSASNKTQIDSSLLSHAIAFSKDRLFETVAQLGDKIEYPRSTLENGQWETVKPRDWTSGFFPGCLWYIYRLSGDTSFKTSAERWTLGLADQQYLTQTHDIGFIIFNSFGNGYKLDSNQTYKAIILQAAKSLLTRFDPTVRCIKSWDGRKWHYPVIIDNMMNLELLFWASKHGGAKEMYDIAFNHAEKTMMNHFREDGSTYHVVDYDTITGRAIAKETHQGYADESVWARGQAWAVYGFTIAYRETVDPRFLHTAEISANWFIDHLPEDNVPYWDFLAPKIPDEEKDASAAAIAASALFELSTLTKNTEFKNKFFKSATSILRSLCSSKYLAEGTNSYGILLHAVGNHPKNSEIDVSLIYADYYFLESIIRYQNLLRNQKIQP